MDLLRNIKAQEQEKVKYIFAKNMPTTNSWDG